MFVKELPNDVQSILCASVKINNYKDAVEELIYNSLDADSTSIAIRVHIEENSLQVVDNGQGIKKVDMNLIGQRYMTSKYENLSVLKTVPTKYGLRGESLTNIIEVSQIVSITSRYEDTEKTWVKTFNKGKEHELTESTNRPSKGTTVSIKGFLYNRNIQKHAVNELNAMQEIKTFLEQVSLFHSNISLSLRDDAKNSIIFHLHKKRDIYQTLSTVFNIEKNDVKELKVEKNQYRVKAYIGTISNDIRNDWIFLNRKFIYTDSQLHSIVNGNLKKSLKFQKKIIKTKHNINEFENCIFNKYLPFYFMFIECPYLDYIISHKSLEFKSWDKISKLLEKLVNFFIGDINLKEVKTIKYKEQVNSRNQVKEIMKKILGNNSKNKDGLQMQNGVKGKITKRKCKKKNKQTSFVLSITKRQVKAIDVNESKKNPNVQMSLINRFNSKENSVPDTNTNNSISQIKTIKKKGCNKVNSNKVEETINNYNSKKKEDNKIKNNSSVKLNCNPKKRKITKNHKKMVFLKDSISSKFVNPTDSVKKRCDSIAQRAHKVLHYKNKSKDMFINEKDKYDNIMKKLRNNNCRKFDDSVMHNNACFTPILPERYKYIRNINQDIRRHQDNASSFSRFKSTYDLVKTIINSKIENNSHFIINKHSEKFDIDPMNKGNTQIISRLTFESHKFDKKEIINAKASYHKNQSKRFITNQSKDTVLNNKCGLKKSIPKFTSTTYDVHLNSKNINKKQINISIQNSMISNIAQESSYTIEFSKNNQNNYLEKYDCFEELYDVTTPHNINTSLNTNELISKIINVRKEKCDSKNINIDEVGNKCNKVKSCNRENLHISVHNSKESDINIEENFINEINYRNMSIKTNLQYSEVTEEFITEPLNICETVLGSEDIFEREIAGSLNLSSGHFDILPDDIVNISHYFTNINNSLKSGEIININNTALRNNKINSNIDKINQISNPTKDNYNKYQLADTNCNKNIAATDFNNFNFKNRLRFVPKGMSPIFHNCNTKYSCDYFLDEDYYQESLYSNFINEVYINSEVFNPLIKNIKDLGTKGNEKQQNRIHKDNAALKFDGRSLKDAKILGQVDDKYIASIIKGKNNKDEDTLQFLVLFDQHAVHERIRTEKILSDYHKNGNWKSVKLENMNMILCKDEIVYLHNYKDKFNELGLQFTILSSQEISINAIPEAILGKTPRQVDKIMKALRNLIVEEINVIKSQSGCISMYPKSIMDLVFSEACRYAIKFGDRLTKIDCSKLINDLSNCKTPFQCAHGRPVMAIIMDINNNELEYKIDIAKLKQLTSK